MDSFFCPNLTLFNQRFFVCDWSYNVDCNSAHLHYSLNDGLYKSQSAQTISNAINQPVGQAQDEILGGHQLPEIKNYSPEPTSLATSSSQLDAKIAVDNTIITTSVEPIKPSSQDAPQESQDATQESQEDEAPEENPSDSDGSETATGTTDSSDSSVSDNVPDSPSVYYDDVADPEPAAGDISYVSAPLPTYSSYSSSVQDKSFVYDDADPEPAGYYSDDQSDPEPEAYVDGYSYDVSDSSYYYGGSGSWDLTGSQSADPEPTSYDFYSANNYPVYQTQGLVYDPSADPEPSSDPEFTPYDS